MSKRSINLTGERYGRLVVTKEAEQRGYTRRWECVCDCGTPITVTMPNLRNGHTLSCGCLQSERVSEKNTNDLTGRIFGKLTVIKRSDIKHKNRKVHWICSCSCGNPTPSIISSDRLLGGVTESCGCNRLDAIRLAHEVTAEQLTIDGVVVPTLKRKLRVDNTTGKKGVGQRLRKDGSMAFTASIRVKGKTYHLGTFSDIDSAAKARAEGEKKYHQPYIDALEEKENNPPTS